MHGHFCRHGHKFMLWFGEAHNVENPKSAPSLDGQCVGDVQLIEISKCRVLATANDFSSTVSPGHGSMSGSRCIFDLDGKQTLIIFNYYYSCHLGVNVAHYIRSNKL